MINLQQANKKHLFVHLHTTNDCNLDCSYCYNRASARTDRITPKYDPNYLVKLLNEHADAIDIMFYGGEPLLNVDFIDKIISLLQNNQNIEAQFHIVSNGTISFDGLHKLGLLGAISSIWISFDGTKETISKLRGDRVYDGIVQNLALLKGIYFGTLIARMTHTSGFNIADNAFEAGRFFPHVYFQCDNTLTDADSVDFAKIFKYQFNELVDKWLTEYATGQINWLPDNVLGIWYHLHHNIRKNYYHCSPGVGCITIDSYGNVFSCPEGETPESHSVINDCKLGHISEGLCKKKHDLKARCTVCELLWICGGRCMWTDNESYCDIVKAAFDTVSGYKADIENLVLNGRISEADFYPSLYSEVVP
jgi:radical SAM protein with 4Fe4S-binding SPASM domain